MFQMMQFQEERLYGAAASSLLDRLIDLTIEYTRERKAFGKIASWTTKWCTSDWPSCAPKSKPCER